MGPLLGIIATLAIIGLIAFLALVVGLTIELLPILLGILLVYIIYRAVQSRSTGTGQGD